MFFKKLVFGAITFIFALQGCSSVNHQGDISGRTSVLLPNEIPSGPLIDKHENMLSEISLPEEGAESITLRQAVALALTKNPELAIFSREIRARDARTIQAGLFPNPELSMETEDFAGTGAFQGIDEMQTTIRLSQLIELGGKRSKRKRVSSLERNLAVGDYNTGKINILTSVTHAFIEVLGAQQQFRLAEKTLLLGEQIVRTVSERVRAGKVLPVEETRVNLNLSSIRIEREQARLELDSARKRLAALWGSTNPRYEKAEGDLTAIFQPSSFDPSAYSLVKNSDVVRSGTAISLSKAVVEREKSRGVPDITVSGGYRRFNSTDDNAVVAGVSIPLPIFNKNQGGKQEALHKLSKAEEQLRFIKTKVRTDLAQAYNRLSVAYFEADMLKTKILPGAQTAFDTINEGYRQGKFAYLDVLDTQRTLFNVQVQYTQALTKYHKAVADVEKVTGEPLDIIFAKTDKTQKE